MGKFKHIVVVNGSLKARRAFVDGLAEIGYKTNNESSLCLNEGTGNCYCITVNYKNGFDYKTAYSGELGGYSNGGEYWRHKGVEYQFNIDNDDEFQAALAIAAIRDDEDPHIGEWIVVAEGSCITERGPFQKIVQAAGGSRSFNTEMRFVGYETNFGHTGHRKATPEEIIQYFKTNKSTNMSNSNKEIIGYRTPTDLFNGDIKKGEVYTVPISSLNGCYLRRNTSSTYYMPREIVATWEPVYEEDIIKIGGYTATKEKLATNDVVAFGCQKFDIAELYAYKKLLSSGETKAELSIHDTKITVEILDKLIEML